MRQQFMVGGLAGGSERHDVVLNPYTGQAVGEVHLAEAADAERALQHSVVGARAMRALAPHAVAGILDRAAALVEARAEDFASLIVAEAGEPLYDARGEVARSILNLRAAAEESKRVAGHEVPLEVDGAVSAYQGRRGQSDGGRQRLAVTRRVPIGTVLAVTPFNFPLNFGAPQGRPGPCIPERRHPEAGAADAAHRRCSVRCLSRPGFRRRRCRSCRAATTSPSSWSGTTGSRC